MSRRYSSYTWTEICAFWGMIIASVSYIFSGLFRFLVNWINDISHDVASILSLVSNIMSLLGSIALLVAIAIPAWQYVKYRSKGWKEERPETAEADGKERLPRERCAPRP